MAIVTDGLVQYYNAQQGVSGTSVQNLSPNAPANSNAVLNGATVSANGFELTTSGHFDIPVTDAMKPAVSTSFTVEFRWSMTNVSGWVNFITSGGGAFAYLSPSNGVYWEMSTAKSYATKYDYSMTGASWGNNQETQFTIVFDKATQQIRGYRNGVLMDTKTAVADLFILFNTTVAYINWGARSSVGSMSLWRFYDRALTGAEVTQNYNEGRNVALPAASATPISEVRYGSIILPVYALADIPAGENQLRVALPDQIGAIQLVPTTDPNASGVRIQTSRGLRALRKG